MIIILIFIFYNIILIFLIPNIIIYIIAICLLPINRIIKTLLK